MTSHSNMQNKMTGYPPHAPSFITSLGVPVDLDSTRGDLLLTAKNLIDASPIRGRNLHYGVMGLVFLKIGEDPAQIDDDIGGHHRFSNQIREELAGYYRMPNHVTMELPRTPSKQERIDIIERCINFAWYIFSSPREDWRQFDETHREVLEKAAKKFVKSMSTKPEEIEGMRKLRIRTAPLHTLTPSEIKEREAAEAVHRHKWKVRKVDAQGRTTWVTGYPPIDYKELERVSGIDYRSREIDRVSARTIAERNNK